MTAKEAYDEHMQEYEKPRAGEHPRMYALFGNEMLKLDYFTPELRHRIITCVSALDGIKDVSLIASRVAANNRAHRVEAERDLLREALIEAQRRLNDAKLKGRGNDFYAAIVAVEQDLRTALGKA